jgi:hypothetical protein
MRLLFTKFLERLLRSRISAGRFRSAGKYGVKYLPGSDLSTIFMDLNRMGVPIPSGGAQ